VPPPSRADLPTTITRPGPPRPEPEPRRQPSIDELTGDTNTPPRRPLPAGKVLAVMLLAFLVGSLLNAPGIRKTALGQPVGWRRDVSTFFANPLYDVSHALHLDRLRVGVKDLLGRSSDDHVNTRLPSPTTTTTPGPTPATLPPRVAYSPAHQARLWVGGDSLADTPGSSLITAAVGTGAVGILGPVDSHISTGLARPEVFNWPDYLKQVLTANQPDAVVLTFGANDDQTLTGGGGGQPFGGPDWQAEYARRVGGLMDTVTAVGSHPKLFMVGIPPIRDTARFTNDYTIINRIFAAQAAARRGHVYYVDTVSVLGTPSGGYTDFLPNPDGTVVQIRTADGTHFTRAGGDRIAAAVLAAMRRAFDLDSWRTAGSTTTTTALPRHQRRSRPSATKPTASTRLP
jgi:hypothetical protein